MIILTSISPNHSVENAQESAVESWFKYTESVVSFNHLSEIELLKVRFPKVQFIATERVLEHHFERKHVSVNALLDWAKEQPANTFCLINSDIIISHTKELINDYIKKSETNICIAHRTDFTKDDFSDGKIYRLGIDVFFIHSKFLNIYPQGIYSLGQTYWDYWIPYIATKNKIPVYLIKENSFYHKAHPAQYKHEHWVKMGKFFRWENSLEVFGETQQQLGKMSNHIYQTIMSNAA